jgi:F-type H+/Na+-transporting ATPase subunit alpha
VPVGEVRRFEAEFLQYLRHQHEGVLAAIADGDWNDDIVNSLDEAISNFKDMFLAKKDQTLGKEAEAKPFEGDEAHETVTRIRPKKQ